MRQGCNSPRRWRFGRRLAQQFAAILALGIGAARAGEVALRPNSSLCTGGVVKSFEGALVWEFNNNNNAANVVTCQGREFRQVFASGNFDLTVRYHPRSFPNVFFPAFDSDDGFRIEAKDDAVQLGVKGTDVVRVAEGPFGAGKTHLIAAQCENFNCRFSADGAAAKQLTISRPDVNDLVMQMGVGPTVSTERADGFLFEVTLRFDDPPTNRPTNAPTDRPTDRPTDAPTNRPTLRPTDSPTRRPTELAETRQPTASPTQLDANGGGDNDDGSKDDDGGSNLPLALAALGAVTGVGAAVSLVIVRRRRAAASGSGGVGGAGLGRQGKAKQDALPPLDASYASTGASSYHSAPRSHASEVGMLPPPLSGNWVMAAPALEINTPSSPYAVPIGRELRPPPDV